MMYITNTWARLAVCIGACLGAGWIGSLATRQSLVTWYPQLVKPFFSPPDWLFAPVWTALFLMMGYGAYLVWERKECAIGVNGTLALFAIQLACNTSWSFVFFKFQSLLGGLVVIIVLWVLIFRTIVQFSRISTIASCLLIPYLLWVSFAGVLNFALWRLN